MSSGAFLESFYTTDNGDICNVRTQPETLALVVEGTTNEGPAGPASPGFPSAQVSKGRNSIGINTRLVRIQFPPGGAPTGYSDRNPIALPWFNPTTFAALPPRGTGTYLGSACNYIGKTAEDIN